MTFTENGGRPGDERAFLHKKLLGIVSKVARVLPIPAPIAGIIGGVAGRLAGARAQQKEAGIQIKFGNGVSTTRPRTGGFGGGSITGFGTGGCIWPLRWSVLLGRCAAFVGTDVGPEAIAGQEVGEAVMGQYGAALQPGSRMISRAICLRGMQLGNDGLCYNKSQIRNNQRMWPAGRKPLLSGGDMRAISIASRAGRRMELATKRLQKMGMMKKPTTRRLLTAGHAHARAAKDVVSV